MYTNFQTKLGHFDAQIQFSHGLLHKNCILNVTKITCFYNCTATFVHYTCYTSILSQSQRTERHRNTEADGMPEGWLNSFHVTIFLEKITVAQLIKKFPAFKWAWRFIIMSTRLYPELGESRPHHISCRFTWTLSFHPYPLLF
jgi:hypothetical protein